MNYRSEIDGLRAIAILSVVIFHIDNTWLQSGFLGVDIFFVISGYLITLIMKTQMEQGTFSFIHFYKSRMKRILPAFLIFCLIITSVAKTLFIPQDFSSFIKSLEYALTFRANIYFSLSSNYFDTLTSEKPLLHIWSLSIEEQFYFIFPFMLLCCLRYFSKYIKFFIVILIVLSVSAYFWNTSNTLNMDKYFLFRTRVYELLLGSLFACFTVKEFKNNLYAWFFLIPMLVTLFIPKNILIGDGYIERFIVCLSTGGLILFKPKKLKEGEYYLLSIKPLVMIGLISYSLYLWHWGILAVMRYVYMEYVLPMHYVMIALVLMFGCAILSYRYVELPLKNIKTVSNKMFFGLAFSYCILIFVVYIYHKNIQSQINQPIYHHTTQQVINLDWDEESNCHNSIKNDWKFCQKGDMNQESKILMIGDSHAGQLNELVDYIGKKEMWKADVISADNCRFFILAENPFTNFHDKCMSVYQYTKKNWQNYDIIIYAMYWYKAKDLPTFYQRFDRELQLLTQQGKKVYLIKDNPAVNLVPLRMLRQTDLGIHWYAHIKTCQYEEVANKELEEISKKYTQVYWIDIPKYIPQNLMLDGYPIYKDRDHLNPYGVKQLAIEFAKHERFLR